MNTNTTPETLEVNLDDLPGEKPVAPAEAPPAPPPPAPSSQALPTEHPANEIAEDKAAEKPSGKANPKGAAKLSGKEKLKALLKNRKVLAGLGGVLLLLIGALVWFFTRPAPEAPPPATAPIKAPNPDAHGKPADAPEKSAAEGEKQDAPAQAKDETTLAKPKPMEDTLVTEGILTVGGKTREGYGVNLVLELPVPMDKREAAGKYSDYMRLSIGRYLESAPANALGSPQNRPELIRYLTEMVNDELPTALRVPQVVLKKLVINAPAPTH